MLTVDRDGHGLDLERLRQLAGANTATEVSVRPAHVPQPDRADLTLDQRLALAELAVEHELLVFEDDPYGLLRVEGEPLAAGT